MNEIKDEIKELFQKKSELFESAENKRRMAMWGPNIRPSEYLPGELPPYPASKRKEKRPPITADWDRIQKSILLNFNILKYFKDPLYYLKWTLKIDIHRFETFLDDTPLLKTIPIFLGLPFEPSLFGMPVVYSTEHEPLFQAKDKVIKSTSDLAKLKIPDFYKSKYMSLAHKFYEEIKRVAPKDYFAIFPVLERSPFGIACALRSMEALLMDMITEPTFVHQLMQFLVEARKEYTKARKEFTGESETENDMMNDEASTPILSPELFEEFIFPYENELSKFYGGIGWWHSCGTKTYFINTLKKFNPPIQFTDINWTNDDVPKAIKDLNGEIPYHIRPGLKDITETNEDIIKNNISGIMKLCGKDNYIFRVDWFQPGHPTEKDVKIEQRYLRCLKEVGEKMTEKID